FSIAHGKGPARTAGASKCVVARKSELAGSKFYEAGTAAYRGRNLGVAAIGDAGDSSQDQRFTGNGVARDSEFHRPDVDRFCYCDRLWSRRSEACDVKTVVVPSDVGSVVPVQVGGIPLGRLGTSPREG